MTHPTTEALYDAIGQGITSQDPLGLLKTWLDGPTSLLGEVDDVVRDGDTYIGWAGELTADGTHRTRWTGQLLGVVIPDSADDATARALILSRPAFRRGTVGALRQAAEMHLTGTRRVDILERDTSAYHLTVRTYAQETPDPAVVLRDLLAAKPAGLVLAYVVLTGDPYDSRDAEFATYDALDAYRPTYDDLDEELY